MSLAGGPPSAQEPAATAGSLIVGGVGAAALAAVTGALLATRHGIGLGFDEAQYFSLARSLPDGYSSYLPSHDAAHFPPVYPVLLAAGSLFGELPAVARVLNVTLFATNVVLAGILTRRLAGRRTTLAILAAGLVAASPAVLRVHVDARSEPTFIAFTLLALILATGGRTVSAGATAGLAAITRYAGVALVVAGVGLERGRRIRYVGTAAAVVSAWVLWQRGAGDRPLAWHPPPWSTIEQLRDSLSDWVIPELPAPAAWLGAIAALGAVGTLIAVARRSTTLRPAAAFLLAYGATLAGTVTFLDAHTPLDGRLLAPAQVVAVAALVGCSARLDADNRRRAAAVGFAVLIAAVPAFADRVGFHARHGVGLASPAWSESETLQAAAALPPRTPIYSNAPDALYLLAERDANFVPARFDYRIGAANDDFGRELTGLRRAIKRGAALVWFDMISRDYLPSGVQLANLVPRSDVMTLADGFIVRVCAGGAREPPCRAASAAPAGPRATRPSPAGSPPSP